MTSQIKNLISVGTKATINGDYQVALDYFNTIFNYEKNNEIAILYCIVSCLMANQQNVFLNRYDEKEYIEKLARLSDTQKKDLNAYILDDLYDSDLFDNIMKSNLCIDFLCQYFKYDYDIINLFYSYYMNIDVEKLSINQLIKLENDIVSYTNYVKKYSSIDLNSYSIELLNYAKNKLYNGSTSIFPFFRASLTLYYNNEAQYYYYVCILLISLNKNNDGILNRTLLFEQRNICSIRNNMLIYVENILPIMLSKLSDFSFIQETPTQIELNALINSRLNVCYCFLQFLDGYYYNHENECYQLLTILKDYLRIKLYGNGKIKGNLETYCTNSDELKFLSKLYNENLAIFGNTERFNTKWGIKYFSQQCTNKLLLQDIEKDADHMFAYANLLYKNKSHS